MLILVVLGIPAVLSAAAAIFRKGRAFGAVNCAGYAAVLCCSLALFKYIAVDGHKVSLFNFIYLDTLSAFFVLVVAVVSFAAALYSVGYIRRDEEKGKVSGRKAGMYYVFFNLFSLSMLFVPVVDNLGLMWVAIEMTTLISAFLVGFYNTKESVEAAWKYIVICSVGIILALLGTILFSYAFSLSGGARNLNWTDMAAAAATMDQNILKVAFLFVLVGYGTKAGLSPMHTWLPDAHSQAVAPSSALLSGVLLKTALYAILRFGIIVVKGAGPGYFSHLMILFGVLSLIVSCGFILVQKDLKRLLAYSSIEHVGIIAIGFGIGTTLGVAGAMLHVLNHAVTKSLMFFGAGDIADAYDDHAIKNIRGVLDAMPFAGVMTMIGLFALAGLPPFSVFFSEIMILLAAFLKGAYATAGLVLIVLAAVFGAFVYHFSGMLFGKRPRGMAVAGEPFGGKLACIFLLAEICLLGVALPFFKKDIACIAQRLLQP